MLAGVAVLPCGVGGHPLGEVFVENEAKAVVAKFICVHLAAQAVDDTPYLMFKLLLLVFGHVSFIPEARSCSGRLLDEAASCRQGRL